MELIRCDRCGRMYDRRRTTISTWENIDIGFAQLKFDICDECNKELEKWVNEFKENRNDN